MSEEIKRDSVGKERTTLPIEKGFPIERINNIAEKESRAKTHYRPIYTMHKWWARRLGCVFRSICLYTLVDDVGNISVSHPGEQNKNLSDYGGKSAFSEALESLDMADPESLWDFYAKDVRITDKKVLDPFAGGGTSLVEASRFGAETVGNELNPVAWFVTKKEIEAGSTDVASLESAYEELAGRVKEELMEYYLTPCPNCDGNHQAESMYHFWVKQLNCTSCGDTVSLHKDYRLGKGRYDNRGQYNVLCPDCESIFLVDDWRSECSCDSCGHTFVPEEGTVGGGDYTCRSCGQKYSILDAIQEQDGFKTHLFGVEYYCRQCDDDGKERQAVKGYKTASEDDRDKWKEAVGDWEESEELKEYVPSEEIPLGIKTDSTEFEGSIGGGHNVLRHGYTYWTDMFNDRQLLCLSTILKEIDNLEDEDAAEYLLLALSDSLMFQNTFTIYNYARNNIEGLYKTNSFDPEMEYVENNVWGSKYGRGTFKKSWEKVLRGVEYAHNPTERYLNDNGESVESPPFQQAIGEKSSVQLGDARNLDYEDEFDAVITDPPYYDNVIYSETSDFFYVWLKLLLNGKYEGFENEKTPRKESIVANPAQGKGESEFENEIKQAFDKVHQCLKDDGVLVFTYHHSDSESWGELLQALCDVGFEITATYPINSDLSKLFEGESVSFDIIVVARPARETSPVSWNSLRRDIYRTAQKTRQRLEENRDLSRGDIGVVEMGRCFHEYSKHHGKVERTGETMTAKEVVDEIYGVIQHGSEIGEIDVFLDLLETPGASYNDLNKLCRGTNATPERMEDMRLYRMDNGFTLGTWDDEKRMDYIQRRVDGDEELTDLDKAQFLRYRWEHGKSVSEYLNEWEITDDLRELCEGLADATGDDTYRNILESRLSDF
jgi:putative DNA methylase